MQPVALQLAADLEVLVNVVSDPVSILLVLVGAVLVGVPSVVFGYLTVRGLVAWAAPELGR